MTTEKMEISGLSAKEEELLNNFLGKGDKKTTTKDKKEEVPLTKPGKPIVLKDKYTKKFSEVFELPKGMKDITIPYYGELEFPNKYFMPNPMDVYMMMLAWKLDSSILLYGPPSCGKTKLTEYCAAKIGQEVYRLNGRGDLKSTTILGKPWINADGSMEFQLGQLPKAIREGKIILIDEVFAIPPEIMMVLQRFLEPERELQIDDLETDFIIKDESKKVRIVLTDNTSGSGDNLDKYVSRNYQDTSFLNRINIVHKMDYMKPDRETEWLEKQFDFITEVTADSVVRLANLIRNTGEMEYGPRNLIDWMKTYEATGDIKFSFTATTLNRVNNEQLINTIKEHYFAVFGDRI